jgi:2-keto-4-pentenoate hydratase/2-oxohepta-3-ene-1,7-dioic acid hydratase in catechol pathway
MGPWVVLRTDIPDAQSLDIELRVNNEVRQRSNTKHMIFSIPRIISELSQGLTLEAGDIIATGTPSGVGYAMDPPNLLKTGDVVTCQIEGIGTLENRVV